MEALLSGANHEQAALLAGVTEKTIRNWKQADEWQEAFRTLQTEIMGDTVAMLIFAGKSAVMTLQAIASDNEQPAGVRVRAAAAILSSLISMKASLDFEERLNRLEAQANDPTSQT